MAPLCGSYHGISPLPVDVSLFGSHVPSSTYNATTDTYTDTNGCNYRQLFQEVPALRPLYSEFEASFTALSFVEFANRYFHVAFLICAAYALFLIVGGRIMKDREPFKLRPALILWNIGLASFSLIGFLRTAPHLLYFLYDRGFYNSVCAPSEPSYGHGAVGLWTMLFIYSKIPELGDTVFIILRKNNLIFLHWYHHITVLLYCWHSYMTRSSAGLYFVSMNYGVHAIMYCYYALAASGIKVKWGGIVTILQISQMFVGMGICAAVFIFEKQGLACDILPDNYVAGLVMYASYAVLFIVFALEKYITGKSSLEPKKRPAIEKEKTESKEERKEEDPAPVSNKATSNGVRQRRH